MRFDRDPWDWEGFRLCSLGGSQPSGNTTTTNVSTPWSGEQPFLSDIYSQAQNNDENAIPQYYPSDTYAPLNTQQEGLMGNLIGQTSGGGTTALQNANTTLSNTLSPEYTGMASSTFGGANSVLGNELSSSYLNPANSPEYSTAISNAMNQALPSAEASFVNGNRSDSGLASAAAASAATNAAGGLAQQQYNTNLGIQNQAATQGSTNLLTQEGQQNQAGLVAPMIDQESLNNATTGLNVAGMNQTNSQNQINANVAAYNYGQMLPWNQLGLFESAVTGTGNPGGTTTSTQPYFNNPTANILSGATGLAGLGLGAGLLTAGAAGTGLGPLALFGALSDRRAKTDIERVGESDSGFPLYAFRYKGESPMARHIGLMAQDVEMERPEAVLRHPSGYLMVDYGRALAA